MRRCAWFSLSALLLASNGCGGSVSPRVEADASADLGVDALSDASADAPTDAPTDVPSDVPSDVSDGAIACGTSGAFPTFARACSVDADCAVVEHEINCCGTLVALGIRADRRAAFDAAEAICRGQYPGCGCAASPTTADDGTRYDGARPARAACVDAVCTSTFGLASGAECAPGGAACGAGLACCYPCGVAGCSYQCEPACKADQPGCSNGCWMRA